ncbi:uncharacterized protein TM35_000093210 [Trypanosoma theileri]|uniref:Pentacotripeptide-repeat region of PRORP domain-containing protein n=1 Tax=Trypanosoma theileri TaxID=67003 RepID=A0A1X0P086_9TRYP|nr:uncharacterized protein TM35_000093210 [Trypanosoma theileri]ORC90271.1 hypothetical protein TM35_000093210 [Trypanosoma theileri]
MLQRCTRWLEAHTREKGPNMGRLLYGKRKNALHTTSKAKPGIVGLLLQVPMSELRQAARRAVGVRELNKESLSELLRKLRAVNRLDRSQVVVEVADEAHLSLTSSHYCTLMAHANDNKDWETALRYWTRACHEKKANEKLHGALLAAYRAAGRWKECVQHYNAIIEDKMTLDPYALHTVMNACRRANACEEALSIFSKAVRAGASPNSAVYLELLRCIQQSHLPNRWETSLAVLQSIEGKVDMTAGLFNATMATMGGANWTKGVELFQTMKEKNVQPSKETIATLVSLNSNDVSHAVRCIAEAHSLGMPVTDAMYRTVLANLMRLQLDHEAVRFVENEYKRFNEDPGNPVNSSLYLSLAIIDSLLAHNRPHEALMFFTTFESKLGNIVGSATRGLGSIGLSSQRWIVQGRVAVVDHNVLLNPLLESLLFHYDSVLIPFSSIRMLVRRVREMAGTPKGRYTKNVLKRLQELITEKAPLRVLPLVHQLNAHTYIVDGPITEDSVKLLRKAAQQQQQQEEEETIEGSKGSTVPLLIRKSNALPSFNEFKIEKSDIAVMDKNMTLSSSSSKSGDSLVESSKNNQTVLQYSDRMTAPERVLAVAVMLKSLNPDASIHVVSPNPVQLQVVEKWNEFKRISPLTPVRYPDEVATKAPSEKQQPISSSKTENGVSLKRNIHHPQEMRQEVRRPLFVPS